ncbi:MAG: hypothetical protein F6K14_08305 [Symploca sp. SIO2C1]|nr:hypothetical protein [Symploca sp. SIO2C1]
MTEGIADVVHLKKDELPKSFIDMDLLQEVNNNYSLSKVANEIGVTKKTLLKYRQLAYEYFPEYRESCSERFPEYEDRKKVEAIRIDEGISVRPIYPDPPPFAKVEVDILHAIANLYRSTSNGRKLCDRDVIKVLEANQKQRQAS